MRSLSIENLNIKFPGKILFHETSLTIQPGSITGILGPNGSGKTTLFDVLCEVSFTKNKKTHNTFQSQLYLSQIITTPAVLRMHEIFKMTTILSSDKNLTQQSALTKISRWCPELTDRYKEIWKKKSAICSYGEKRWFFTLSLLAMEPELLILDEPTAGIDPEFRHYTWQCLTRAAREGTAIVVSSHSIEEVTAHCDFFYMISQYKLKKFHSGEEFTSTYSANTLDEAFIKAAALKAPLIPGPSSPTHEQSPASH